MALAVDLNASWADLAETTGERRALGVGEHTGGLLGLIVPGSFSSLPQLAQ